MLLGVGMMWLVLLVMNSIGIWMLFRFVGLSVWVRVGVISMLVLMWVLW